MEPDNNAAPSLVAPDVLAAAAADLAAGTAPAVSGVQPGQPQPAAQDPNAEAKDLVEFAFSLFKPLYPSLENVYTPDTRAHLAATAAPLLTKYNLSLGKLGPELMFSMAVIPLIAPTVQAIRADRAGAAPEKPAATTVPAAPVDAQPPAVSPLAGFPGVQIGS